MLHSITYVWCSEILLITSICTKQYNITACAGDKRWLQCLVCIETEYVSDEGFMWELTTSISTDQHFELNKLYASHCWPDRLAYLGSGRHQKACCPLLILLAKLLSLAVAKEITPNEMKQIQWKNQFSFYVCWDKIYWKQQIEI